MGVSIVRYQSKGDSNQSWGVLNEEGVHPLQLEGESHRDVMQLYISDPAQFKKNFSSEVHAIDDLEFFSPIYQDTQLFCQGLNYADHRAESGLSEMSELEENLIFQKSPSSICGPTDDIVRPKGCELLDYEIELGLVLKQDVTRPLNVDEAHLNRYIGGLVLANDVSARDIMFGAPMLQWFKGKSFRTFCPMGPILYLMDDGDFEKLYDLQLTLKLNGEIRQQATTDMLIHKPAKTLSDISVFSDIRMGDCILTGTPGGVLVESNLRTALAIVLNLRNDAKRRHGFTQAQLRNKTFLTPGDLLELEIKSLDGSISLGKQRNRIVDPIDLK